MLIIGVGLLCSCEINESKTTQGEYTYEEMLSIEPDYIYYDTSGCGLDSRNADAAYDE